MLIYSTIAQTQNLLNPESISVFSVLVVFLGFLLRQIAELKSEKEKSIADIKADNEKTVKEIREDYAREIMSLNARAETLTSEVSKLQDEKYKVTREVIPLLIKLIDKLNEDG